MSQPFEVAATGEGKGAIVVGRRSQVLFVARVTHPRIGSRIVAGDLCRAVSRCVVRDDELEIAHALREHRSDGFFEEGLAVENGKADAHEGAMQGAPFLARAHQP